MTKKLVLKYAKDPRISEGLRRRLEPATLSAAGLGPSRALALGYRFAAAGKALLPLVRELARPVLDDVPRSLDWLDDAGDRFYLASAVVDDETVRPWLADYLARSIATEEGAEKARHVHAARLFAILPIAEAISKIATELERAEYSTKKPQEATVVRFRRVIEAIRPALVTILSVQGGKLGPALRELFTKPFYRHGRPLGGATLNQVSSAACALVYDILRTQISVVSETAIYGALSVFRITDTPSLWSRFARTNEHAQRVILACESAILLTCRQGSTDQQMLQALADLIGSRDAAKQRTAQIASSNIELTAEVREWLSNFGKVTTSSNLQSFELSRERSADYLIAGLMAISASATRSVQSKPNEAEALVNVLAIEIASIGSARRLTLRHGIGDLVDYSPTAHELVGGHQLGVRQVRVLRPLVERADGVIPEILMKAVVEKY